MRDTPDLPGPLLPVAPLLAPCKCCGATARLYGVVDFHKNCEIVRGRTVLGLSGIPVYYHRCPACGLIFTMAFDHFSQDDFARHIYNDDYAAVDPDYREQRPAGNAKVIADLFAASRSIRILDYGGGNGRLAALLRQAGFGGAETYDPFVPAASARPAGRFDLILSFEVAEHSNQPRQTFADITSLLAEDGIVLFSTLLQPPNIDQLGVGWWYIAPRNGHVSIFSRKALEHVARGLGFRFGSSTDGVHALYRRVPSFARHFITGG